jgi:hypothetical protein
MSKKNRSTLMVALIVMGELKQLTSSPADSVDDALQGQQDFGEGRRERPRARAHGRWRHP